MRIRTALMLAASMILAVGMAEGMRPAQRLSEAKPPIALEAQVPVRFGHWKEDRSIVPVLPSPDVQASLDKLYSSTLARAYVNDRGERVMLSIAYGSDQSSSATAVHRPEFCYSAQGFSVTGAGDHQLALDGGVLPVRRLIGEQGRRFEPITYWITIDEEAALPGFARKLEQLRFGLRGQIPDGMLVRVSTVGLQLEDAFRLQEQFVRDLRQAMAPDIRTRYFGS